MNWVAGLFIGFWTLYCGTFCCMVLYYSIVEEWCCINRLSEWSERIIFIIHRDRYNIVIDQDNDVISTV